MIPMEYTGERMVPEVCDFDTFWKHIYRYRFARQFVKGQRVVDIACGEGYGTAALVKAGAASVLGIDVDAPTCRYAANKYGIETRIGDAQVIPLPDDSADVVVSFETIEHVNSPSAFLCECSRILSRGGKLVLSTPNKDIYSRNYRNPFHPSEMTLAELTECVSMYFSNVKVYSQYPTAYWPRGQARLQRWLWRFTCPHFRSNAMERYRQDPVSAILANNFPDIGSLVPYVVCQRNPRFAYGLLSFTVVADNR